MRHPLKPGLLLSMVALLPSGPAAAAPPAPPDARPVPSAVLARAHARMSVAEYADAADGLERFVQIAPADARAPEALMDAVVLRLGLGEEDRATQDAKIFLRDYGAKRRLDAVRVSFALAAHAAEKEDWAGAQKQLSAWVTAFDASAPLDLRAQAHALLGRAWSELRQPKKAAPEYAVVEGIFRDPQRMVKETEGDLRRLGKALDAEGEALYFTAELKRAEAERIHFPEYHGNSSKDDVLRHVRTKVADWAKKRRAALEEAERAYRRVLEIEPAPPPRWVVRAASRVGALWARFAAELRAAPVPREWKGNGLLPGTTLRAAEIRAYYYQALDGASEPMRQRATAAFKLCLDDSVKFQFTDASADRCFHWLSRYHRADYRPVDEILPRPGLLGPALPPSDPLPDPRPR